MLVMRPTCYWSIVVVQCLIFLCANQISGSPSLVQDASLNQVLKIMTAGIDADIIKYKPSNDLTEHIENVCKSIVEDAMKKVKRFRGDGKDILISNCAVLYRQKSALRGV